jgi:hypothetical protein
MTAIEIWNLALLKIGVTQTVQDLSEASREAWTGALVYDHYLRAALRRFPWAFATKYQRLVLIQGPAWPTAIVQAWDAGSAGPPVRPPQVYAPGVVVMFAGNVYYCIQGHTADASIQPPHPDYWTSTPPENANGDWYYAYREPIDCVFERRLVPPGNYGRRFHGTPIPFRKGRDTNGLMVFSNEQDAVLEYTTLDCLHLWTDDLFVEYLTWLLASAAAPGLTRIADMSKTALQMAENTIAVAEVVDAREAQQEKPGDAEWIRARGGYGAFGDYGGDPSRYR